MSLDFNDPDVLDSFADDELAGNWARAGKGRQLWQPGEKTDDPRLDKRLLHSAWVLSPPTLHVYETCPFCTRTRLVLGWSRLPFACRYYPYGEGADPSACGGFGYAPSDGPVRLTGKKQLPVLTGKGLPSRDGVEELIMESLEICSFAGGAAKEAHVAPATGRGDIASWLERVQRVSAALVRPRLIKLPVSDFADPRDIEYIKWKNEQSGFDYAAAEAQTASLLAELQPLLDEVQELLRSETEDGSPCLNAWGLGIDDALVLPVLRNLSCVEGVEWPAKVVAYLEKQCAKSNVKPFFEFAC